MNDAALLDTRVRVRLLTDEHRAHRLTVNIYLNGAGASDARVWCSTCVRTLRAAGRVVRGGEEVEIGVG